MTDGRVRFEQGPHPRPRSWRYLLEAGRRTATATCHCGRRNGLGGHHIAPSGDVSPSVVCDREAGGCGWHGFITLEGWGGGESPSRP